MSKASRAAYEALKNTPSLKYGDFDVTKDWLYAANPLAGHGGAGTVVFNPNNSNQRFTLDKFDNQLSEYLTLDSRRGQVDYDQLGNYFKDLDPGPRGTYDTLFAETSLEKLAEQKRLQELVSQFQSGAMTREQIDAAANNSSLRAQPSVQNVYQSTYDATKLAQANDPGPASGVTAAMRAQDPTLNPLYGKAKKGGVQGKAINEGMANLSSPPSIQFSDIQTAQQGLDREALARLANTVQPKFSPTPAPMTSPGMQFAPNVSPISPPASGSQASPVTAPVVNTASSSLTAAETDYSKLLQPSAAENDIQTQLNNLYASRDLGIEGIRQQPVAMPFITGQNAAVERMANIKVETLQRRLALEQAKRQASLDASKFSLERADQKAEILRQEAKDAKAQLKEISEGQSLVSYDPNTGTAKTVFSQPKTASADDQRANQKFLLENNITQPYYVAGNIIYASKDLLPKFQFVDNGTGVMEVRSIDGAKKYSSEAEFFKDAGISKWSQLQTEIGQAAEEKHSAIYTEWQDYVREQQRIGKPAMDFNAYQTMDANRKKANISVSLPSLAKEYEYARGQGFQGTMLDYAAEKASRTSSGIDNPYK